MLGSIHYVVHPERGKGWFKRGRTDNLQQIINAYSYAATKIYVYDEGTHESYCILYFEGKEVLRIPITLSQFTKV